MTMASAYDEEGPDDELVITSKPRMISPDKKSLIVQQGKGNNDDDDDDDDDLSYDRSSSFQKKKVRKNHPWKQSKEYDSLARTDDLDICGVHNIVSPSSNANDLPYPDADSNANTKTSANTNALPYPDAQTPAFAEDDDISYDATTAMAGTHPYQTDCRTPDAKKAFSMEQDIDPTIPSRWTNHQPSTPEEIHSAHVKGVSLAAERAAKADLHSSSEMELDDDLSLADGDGDGDGDDSSRNSDYSRKSNHAQVRMEALKLLEMANHTGEKGTYLVKDGFTPSGTAKFKSMKVQGRQNNSSLRGLGLGSFTNRKQRSSYDKLGVGLEDYDNNSGREDIFTTNPVASSPIRGSLDDVQICENMDDLEDGEGVSDSNKKSWGSRYSIDRHLRALHGGLTSQQMLSKMDRDHYNKLNQNTSANKMCKTSPHENEDDRWDVSGGKKGEQHKNRLWFTIVESVKATVTNVVASYENRSSAQWRSADHSSEKRGIFTGIAMTNFLDRLSPKSRKDASQGKDGSGSAFGWRNVNLVDNSKELPDMNFSSNDDISYERRKKRKNVFWLVVLVLSLIALFSVIGTSVHKARSGRVGGGYISVGEEVKFYVTNDIPFNKADETKLSRDLDELNPRDGDFLIHLGDISRASTSLCTFSVYDDAAALLKQSPLPVIVLPGDNDWNDCPMPEAAFDYWMEKLNKFESNFDTASLSNFPSVNRQVGRDENFAFLHKGVLFIGIHLVDGTVQSEREWSLRDSENLQWVEEQLNLYELDEYRSIVMFGHAGYSSKVGDFFWPAMDDLKRVNKPVLYLHANDGEGMIEYHPVEDFRKFTAVRMEKGSKVAPTQITIGGGAKPFSFDVKQD